MRGFDDQSRGAENAEILIVTACPRTLLVVEDESSLLTSLCRGLREEGYDAIGARTAQDARNALLAQSVDAIVLDLMLPDNDGFGLLSNFAQRASADQFWW